MCRNVLKNNQLHKTVSQVLASAPSQLAETEAGVSVLIAIGIKGHLQCDHTKHVWSALLELWNRYCEQKQCHLISR